ncbi:helix-turn-helix domain-containing protein [Salmonella enterica subsp. enterica]|nr:XRE family transcriptional regulator [Salmonella enterica subsp. enterica serovar Weltevreden]ECF7288322.1 XRE family transcriptional regulator [Salmonella enterica subsp. enterica]ECZ8071224.1 helix-turn-helix domain-containing protein [Salmonella enterica]EDT9215178.1 helix-turn-helix domain-containing protein [Salmonella enterica subsp. enterica serovar Rissen]ECP8400899.1 helix-turn-helix domain-containing protein [Salmonella enterica subsp. enterica serovar Weltevreden]
MINSEPQFQTQEENRKALGAFLRNRRESLEPQHLGLPPAGRRRTAGLRREEVAMLADIGVTWYTWLEQGRDIRPSARTINAIADVLQCSPAETRHLFLLSGLVPEETAEAKACESVSPEARCLLDALMPQPACLQMPNIDLVGYNRSFCHLVGVDLDLLAPEDRNCIYLWLTSTTWRGRHVCTEDIVLQNFVAYFRAGMVEHRGESRWEALLTRFFAASPEFEMLWHQLHDVGTIENRRKTFVHPRLGQFSLQQMYWYSAPRNGARLLVYLPVDEAGERALASLAQEIVL